MWVDLTADIYVWYKDFDGVRYIQRIANANSGAGLLLHAKEEGTICKIAIGEDHVGITEVHFAPSHQIKTRGAGTALELWWRVLNANEVPLTRTVTDVCEATTHIRSRLSS